MLPASLFRPVRCITLRGSFTSSRNSLRPFSTVPQRLSSQQHPDKSSKQQREAQLDREKIDRDPNEYSKSGTDEASAANEEAAFDPNITDPQEAKKKAGEGNRGNPLDASPANPKLSEGTSEEEGGLKPKASEK